MTVKECYEAMGGDYEGILSRMRKEERVIKFALKFLADKSYEELCSSLADGDMDTAFRAAHTLKGVSQNLSFTRLFESSHRMAEALRPGAQSGEDPAALLGEVTADYEVTASAIRKLQESVGA